MHFCRHPLSHPKGVLLGGREYSGVLVQVRDWGGQSEQLVENNVQKEGKELGGECHAIHLGPEERGISFRTK